MQSMGQVLRPMQPGYKSLGGAEVAVYATRLFVSETSEDRVLLKLDYKNAFNTIRRDALMAAVTEFIPAK